MLRIPGTGVTCLTVAANREGLQVRVVRRGKATVSRAMAVGTVFKMRRCGGTCQLVLMTGCTVIGSRRRYQSAVIRCRRVDRAPGRAVTRRTVAASGEVLAVGAVRRYQATVCIMTVHTTRMRIGRRTPQSIVMAGSTVGCSYLHQ